MPPATCTGPAAGWSPSRSTPTTARSHGRQSRPGWSSDRCYVVGGGPSLRGRDLSDLRSSGFVLGVNRAADLIPVDATFSLDLQFIQKYRDRLREWASAHRVILAVPPDYDDPWIPGAVRLERVQGKGLDPDGCRVINGLNSGYGALHVALVTLGFLDVVLLGFDMAPIPREAPTHWHDGYGWHNRRTGDVYYGRWADRFLEIALDLPPGARVVNANPGSRIRAFPTATYEEYGL